MRRNPRSLGLLLALGILAGACSNDPSGTDTTAGPAALQLDGFDDFVQVPASQSLASVGAGDFTWEIRFRRGRVGVREDILTKKDTLRDSEHDAAIVIEGDGRVSAFLRATPFTAQTILVSRTQLDTGWVRVAMARSAGVVRLYVNGRLENMGTAAFSVASNGPLRIGANRSNNAGADAAPLFPFAGRISEVRIWNVARTEAEIAEAAVTCVPRGAPGLVADFRFSDRSGRTLSDASGRGNDGQLRNGPTWVGRDRSCG